MSIFVLTDASGKPACYTHDEKLAQELSLRFAEIGYTEVPSIFDISGEISDSKEEK